MTRYEIDFLSEYTDEALLNELRRIAALLSDGERLTKTSYNRFSPKAAQNTISRRFGGWKEALEKAGLGRLYVGQPVSQKMRAQLAKRICNDDLIAELKRVHALVGKDWLTSDDFNANSVTSEVAIRLRFGSYRKGLERAGIPYHPGKLRQFSDEQCFENLAAVWTHYGRAPAYREMFEQPSKIQGKTYVIRWGTWRKTLKTFVHWANSEEANEQAAGTLEANKPNGETINYFRQKRTDADCREIRPGLRFKVFMRDRFRCLACGRSPATHLNIELHADHVLAVANDGKTVAENLQTLCQDCNLGKGKLIVTEMPGSHI